MAESGFDTRQLPLDQFIELAKASIPETDSPQMPPKIYDEIVGRAWHMRSMSDDEGASFLLRTFGIEADDVGDGK